MPLILNFPTLKLTSLLLQNFEDLTVNYLLSSGLNSWNNVLVRAIFTSVDATNILAMPLYLCSPLDQHVWKPTSDGFYTVKFAYRTCSDLIHANTTSHGNARWNSIWNMKVPQIICAFIWRLAHQCLPTRTNLLNHGISYEDSCISCDLFAETQMHTFFVCSKANQCWNLVGLHYTIQVLLSIAINFTTMLFDLFDTLQVHQQVLTTITL